MTPDPAPVTDDDITVWLARLAAPAGSPDRAAAAEQVYAGLYGELHRLARSQMRRERDDHTLTPTALVSEAWLRLSQQSRAAFNDRGHFLALAATMMRRILVDHALARRAAKRSAELEPLDTTWLAAQAAAGAGGAADGPGDEVVAVHEALLAFETVDARAAKVVELKFFAGLEIEEIAQALAVSPATVKRDWTVARAWLRRELGGGA
jgi:RNA polymerase sigma factor (TIGR02999 family)